VAPDEDGALEGARDTALSALSASCCAILVLDRVADELCPPSSDPELGVVECFEAPRLVPGILDTSEVGMALEATFESSVNPDSSALLTTDCLGSGAVSDEVLLEPTLLGACESVLDVEDTAASLGRTDRLPLRREVASFKGNTEDANSRNPSLARCEPPCTRAVSDARPVSSRDASES